MVIQTRFGFGEVVWFLRGSMVDKGCVFSINVDVRYEGVKVKYTIQWTVVLSWRRARCLQRERRRRLMEIGDSIRKLRMWREMTQKELAQRIGMSANALCAIELNRAFPAKETIVKVCRELGVPVGYLLFFALTEEDIPQDKRELFRILREDLCDVLLSE